MQKMRTAALGSSVTLNYSKISFLIVDDQPYTRRIVRSMLVGFGSRDVHESADGTEALELARTAIPNIIITDLVMPASNGMKLIAALKAPESPVRPIPIIVLSGYLTRTTALSIFSSGADEVLVKPVSPKVLHEHIARVVVRMEKAGTLTSIVSSPHRRADAGRKQGEQSAFL